MFCVSSTFSGNILLKVLFSALGVKAEPSVLKDPKPSNPSSRHNGTLQVLASVIRVSPSGSTPLDSEKTMVLNMVSVSRAQHRSAYLWETSVRDPTTLLEPRLKV